MHEVCHWLNGRGFVSYVDPFFQNEIDGEILVNDLNATILHEDLEVKRFHTGKMLREIQTLRQGGLYTECDHITDVAYEPLFSAQQVIDTLQSEKEALTAQIGDLEAKMEELVNRPQIEDHQKIVEIAEWDELIAEKERLASQVDEYEATIDDIQQQAVPAQEMAERDEKLNAFIEELGALKESESHFGDKLRCVFDV